MKKNKEINDTLMKIYNLMYSKTGSRHWWPADTAFEVIVGAILTQFVSWKNVTTAIENLKMANALSVDGICNISCDKLENQIRSTRFYKQKAKRLKDFCIYLKSQYNGNLAVFFDKSAEELRPELLKLYGIGKETADCIILYAAKKPIFVIDAYTKRVFNRLGILFNQDIGYDDMQKFFMDNLENSVELFNEYHAQIDGIGSNFCYSKNPKCNECPISSICEYCMKKG